MLEISHLPGHITGVSLIYGYPISGGTEECADSMPLLSSTLYRRLALRNVCWSVNNDIGAEAKLTLIRLSLLSIFSGLEKTSFS